MKKDILRYIKNDMWETRHCKKDVRDMLKYELAELETRRKEELNDNAALDVSPESLAYFNRQTNERYNKRRQELIGQVIDRFHNDQMYHLIYKDGSEVCILAEEILSGAQFPKMSDIVYAEMSSGDDHMDTESGDLHWYTDESMEACGWDYDAEDERRWQYETAIQFKFGIEWSQRYSREHPEFVPMAV